MSSTAAYVATSENTASLSYTDLATTTDTVTVDVPESGMVLVTISSLIYGGTVYHWRYVSYAMSGENTRSADDAHCIYYTTEAYSAARLGAAFLETGLNPGSTTFKMKYKTNYSYGTFADRRIAVIPVFESDADEAYVATQETTTSTSYTDLTTTTDTVTVDIGSSGQALVLLCSTMQCASAGYTGWVGYALSGNNTRSASDARALMHYTGPYGVAALGAMFLETGLSTGSTTFKMKYRGDGDTTYASYRRIAVIPLS